MAGGRGSEWFLEALAVVSEIFVKAAAEGGEEAAQVQALVSEDAGGNDIVLFVMAGGIKPGWVGAGSEGIGGDDEGDLEDGEGAEHRLCGEVGGGWQRDSHRFLAGAALGR